jgi:hypothetical protein
MKLPIFVKNDLFYANFEELGFLNRMEIDKKKTSIFWSIHGSKICHSCQILLKFHRIFHPHQLLDVQIVIGQTFTLKKTLYFCTKIFPYALADGPVTLYTANLFNLEINVNLMSYQNL